VIKYVLPLLLLAVPIQGRAQPVDWCKQDLSPQASPQDQMIWRLRCTVDKLDSSRAGIEDAVTQAEIATAAETAKFGHLAQEYGDTKSKLDDTKSYWKSWLARLGPLFGSLDKMCAWRGVKTRDMAETCRIWGHGAQ
jgi:hypothetical protein